MIGGTICVTKPGDPPPEVFHSGECVDRSEGSSKLLLTLPALGAHIEPERPLILQRMLAIFLNLALLCADCWIPCNFSHLDQQDINCDGQGSRHVRISGYLTNAQFEHLSGHRACCLSVQISLRLPNSKLVVSCFSCQVLHHFES